MRFEDDTVMRLYRQTIEDFGLFAGMELTDDQMEQLRIGAGEMSAKMRAVRIVSASSVSRKDLEQRLIHKGEDPVHAKDAVDWMCNMHLVDDKETAQQIVDRCITKGYGLSRARQALYEKRIPKEYWDEVLEDYPEQMEAIVSYLRNKLDDSSDQKEVRKAIDALLRKGHSYNLIRRGLERISLDADEFPED